MHNTTAKCIYDIIIPMPNPFFNKNSIPYLNIYIKNALTLQHTFKKKKKKKKIVRVHQKKKINVNVKAIRLPKKIVLFPYNVVFYNPNFLQIILMIIIFLVSSFLSAKKKKKKNIQKYITLYNKM